MGTSLYYYGCHYYLTPKAGDTLDSGQEITKCIDLKYVDPLILLGYTFVSDNDETDQRSEVK